MYYKIDPKLEFETKRNTKLITPCCKKNTKDGKFVNYKNLPDNYGYCHSCGVATLPPTIYKNEKGDEFIWNNLEKQYTPIQFQTYYKNVSQLHDARVLQRNTDKKKKQKYIPLSLINRFLNNKTENNLLRYLGRMYGDKKMQLVKKMYYIGTSKDKGTIFWNINIKSKVQKAKVSYYDPNGKRTNYFKVPYKNTDGYYGCLFGEHLINKEENIGKTLVLVESEKTALVCAMHLPEFVWLSYGGINGLTSDKLKVLYGHDVILIPDISENAVSIMKGKMAHLNKFGIKAKIWDMTNGKTDKQLKKEGWYNCDLEDVFRAFIT
tara:strand:- start:4130 stop:5092 length:963 start_codon:yes stop_codon:yes gene_type:complete